MKHQHIHVHIISKCKYVLHSLYLSSLYSYESTLSQLFNFMTLQGIKMNILRNQSEQFANLPAPVLGQAQKKRLPAMTFLSELIHSVC